MSALTCACGVVVRYDEHPQNWAISLDLAEWAKLEEEAAHTVVRFLAQTGPKRDAWLRNYFGRDYPIDLSNEEIVHDLISREVNSRNFSTIFLCPECGRLAVAPGPDRNTWSFFLPE